MNSIAQDNVTFRLLRVNGSNTIKDHYGNFRRFPRNYGLKAEVEVLDEEGNLRVMRNLRGQSTPYADMQITDRNKTLSSRLEKPNFQDGLLIVPSNQKTLLEFLRKHPDNEDNQHYRFRGQKPIFKEHKPHVVAREQNESARSSANALRLLYEADFKTKLIPIAKYLGFNTDRS